MAVKTREGFCPIHNDNAEPINDVVYQRSEAFASAVLGRTRINQLVFSTPGILEDDLRRVLRVCFRTWRAGNVVRTPQFKEALVRFELPCTVLTTLIQVAMQEFYTQKWLRDPKPQVETYSGVRGVGTGVAA